jgi:hypothetical protein
VSFSVQYSSAASGWSLTVTAKAVSVEARSIGLLKPTDTGWCVSAVAPPSAGRKRTTLGAPGRVPSEAIGWEPLASGELTGEALASGAFVGEALATALTSDVDAPRGESRRPRPHDPARVTVTSTATAAIVVRSPRVGRADPRRLGAQRILDLRSIDENAGVAGMYRSRPANLSLNSAARALSSAR